MSHLPAPGSAGSLRWFPPSASSASRVVFGHSKSPAVKEAAPSGGRALGVVKRAYAATGLRVPMSVVALVGGLALEATRRELPLAYT